MPSKKKSTAIFAIGDSVRVKLGIADPDYSDIPIGGWAGHVVEREEGKTWFYLVSWSRHTFNSMAAIYRSRCERDGLDDHDGLLEGDGKFRRHLTYKSLDDVAAKVVKRFAKEAAKLGGGK